MRKPGQTRPTQGAPFGERLFCVLFMLSAALVLPAPASAEGQPNIIVVMADDHAQWALGAYGLPEIDTPNIDWLAEQGVLFRNAMTPAPVLWHGIMLLVAWC